MFAFLPTAIKTNQPVLAYIPKKMKLGLSNHQSVCIYPTKNF
jgi:hypothetical protein